MKRLFYILFLLVSFIFLGTVTNALDYENTWINRDFSLETANAIRETNDGYLVGGFDETGAYIIKLDKNGEEVKKTLIEGQVAVVDLKEIKGKIYSVVLNDTDKISVYVLDTNLKITNHKETNYYSVGWNNIVYFGEERISVSSIGWDGFTGVSDEDDNNRFDVLSISYDLDNTEVVNFEASNNLGNHYPSYYSLFLEEDIIPYSIDNSGDVTIVVGSIVDNNNNTSLVRFYNKNTLVKELTKDDLESKEYFDIKIIDNNAYLVGSNNGLIKIYDLKGNHIEDIDIKKVYTNDELANRNVIIPIIEKNKDGFIFVDNVCSNEQGVSNSCDKHLIKYSKKYNIEIKESENGSIKVENSSSYANSSVKYTAEAKDGFVLEKIIVKDRDDNTIEINDNSFVMPYSDVTIEAEFVLAEQVKEIEEENPTEEETENPETASGIVGMMGLLALSSLLLFISYKRFKRLV